MSQEEFSQEEMDADFQIDEENEETIYRRTKIIFDEKVHSTIPWIKSKKFNGLFDILMLNGVETKHVVCKNTTCRTIFNKNTSSRNLSSHAEEHTRAIIPSQKQMTDAVLKFIICASLSFHLVANKAFLNFLKIFQNQVIDDYKSGIVRDPKDLLPCPNTLSNRVVSHQEKAYESYSKDVEELKRQHGSLTLDFAKKNVDFLAVTAHYVDSMWNLINFVILFLPFPINLSKTTENVEAILSEEFAQIGIEDGDRKNFYTTTDEGANVGGGNTWSNIGGENHNTCLCHIGSTISKRATKPYTKSKLPANVKQLMKEVDTGLMQMEKLVNELRKDPIVKELCGHTLKPPCETRWLSYFYMVAAVLTNITMLENFFETFMLSDSTSEALLELARKPYFRDYVEILRPIEEMVKEFQTQNEPTSPRILENIAFLWKHLSSYVNNPSEHAAAMAMGAFETFEKKIGNLSDNWLENGTGKINKELVVCSSFLDPISHSQIKSICAEVPGLNYDQMKNFVLAKAKNLSPVDHSVFAPTQRRTKFASSVPSALEDQLNSYISLGPVDLKTLDFWRNHENLFPTLVPLVKKSMAGQASSSPSEFAFKDLRMLIGNFTRNKMNPAKTANLIRLKSQFSKELE